MSGRPQPAYLELALGLCCALLLTAAGCAQTNTPAHHSAAASPSNPQQTQSTATPASPIQVNLTPLAATQFPGYSIAKWTVIGPPKTQELPVSDVHISECAVLHGAKTWEEQGYMSAFESPASNDVYTFADADAAQSAYQGLISSMDACQGSTRTLQTQNGKPADATVARTASLKDATAYMRQWTGVAGLSAGGLQINHYFICVQGNVVDTAQFTEGVAGGAFPAWPQPYDTSGDTQALTVVANHLAGRD